MTKCRGKPNRHERIEQNGKGTTDPEDLENAQNKKMRYEAPGGGGEREGVEKTCTADTQICLFDTRQYNPCIFFALKSIRDSYRCSPIFLQNLTYQNHRTDERKKDKLDRPLR